MPKFKAMHSAGAVIILVIPREGPLGERGWGLVELWEQGKKSLLGRSSIGRGLGTAAALYGPEAWCSACAMRATEGDGAFSLAHMSAQSSKLGVL